MKNSFATKLLNFVLLIIFIEVHAESASNRKCRLGTRIPHPYDCGKYMVKYKLNDYIHLIFLVEENLIEVVLSMTLF